MQHVSPGHIIEAIRCQLARKSNATNSKRQQRRRRRLEVPPSRRRQLRQHATKAPRALGGDRSKQDTSPPPGGKLRQAASNDRESRKGHISNAYGSLFPRRGCPSTPTGRVPQIGDPQRSPSIMRPRGKPAGKEIPRRIPTPKFPTAPWLRPQPQRSVSTAQPRAGLPVPRTPAPRLT